MVKVLNLRGPGTNCDRETEFAFIKAGASVENIYIKSLIENREKIKEFQIVAIPGGFTFGDDLGAGKVFSILLKNFLFNELKEFINRGGLIIGICNGFQILVKTGLIPGITDEQIMTLTTNKIGMFYDGWIKVKRSSKRTPFLFDIDEIPLPVANKEGRVIFKDDASRNLIIENELIALKYVGFNPSGSEFDIAGMTDITGNVFGLMPHPERNIFRHSTPDAKNGGDGFKIFKNGVEYFK